MYMCIHIYICIDTYTHAVDRALPRPASFASTAAQTLNPKPSRECAIGECNNDDDDYNNNISELPLRAGYYLGDSLTLEHILGLFGNIMVLEYINTWTF